MANQDHYVSTTRLSMATKLGRMIVCPDGLLPIILIAWPLEMQGSLIGGGSAHKHLSRHQLLVYEAIICSKIYFLF